MQKQTPPKATKTVYPILRQIVNLIPPNVFHAAASATRDLSRAFMPWSHVVALIYQQLTKTESLNGVCDAARLHAFKKRHSSLRSGNCASADSRESYEQASG